MVGVEGREISNIPDIKFLKKRLKLCFHLDKGYSKRHQADINFSKEVPKKVTRKM